MHSDIYGFLKKKTPLLVLWFYNGVNGYFLCVFLPNIQKVVIK